MIELTAKQMHHAPAQAFRAADKGEWVRITHKHYPDTVFVLTAINAARYDKVSKDELRGLCHGPISVDKTANDLATMDLDIKVDTGPTNDKA